MKDFDVMGLYATTAKHLRESKKPFTVIANDMGVSFKWVYDYSNESMKDPGVNKSERLYTYLTGRSLKLVA